jgi:hypothetical protein
MGKLFLYALKVWLLGIVLLGFTIFVYNFHGFTFSLLSFVKGSLFFIVIGAMFSFIPFCIFLLVVLLASETVLRYRAKKALLTITLMGIMLGTFRILIDRDPDPASGWAITSMGVLASGLAVLIVKIPQAGKLSGRSA